MCTKLTQVPGSVIAFYLAVGCFARRASSAGFDMRTSLRLQPFVGAELDRTGLSPGSATRLPADVWLG